MAASEGVDLEWEIVKLLGGKDNNKKHSSKILKQGKECVKHIQSFSGNKKIQAWHSDDSNNPIGKSISAKPEPKTDIVLKIGTKIYLVSVKMAGGIQLASGQGQSTAELFEAAAEGIKQKRVLKSLIKELKVLPTRLLSDKNVSRILKEGKEKTINEFLKKGKVISDKSYDRWLKEDKLELMASMLDYLQNNNEFAHALIFEALTGKKSLSKFKGAAADSIISPKGFFIIDRRYVDKIKNKVKFDIRGKSRKGITSLALRIEVK
jgi:hypothetical protein